MLLDEPGREIDISSGPRVTHSVVGQRMLLVPGGGASMQLREPRRLLLLQARAQEVGKQMVVAPPAPHLVHRHKEQVRSLDLLQHLLAVAAACDGVAERPRQPLQDRRLQQEVRSDSGWRSSTSSVR